MLLTAWFSYHVNTDRARLVQTLLSIALLLITVYPWCVLITVLAYMLQI